MKKHNVRFNNIYRIFVCIIIILAVTVMVSPKASADSNIGLTIDGRSISTSPKPYIENSRTLVPIRVVSEELGAQVTWNNDERTVYIVKGNRSVKLRIDSNLIKYGLDDQTVYNLSDIAPKIVDSRTFVPLRLVSNALGVGIEWDDKSRTVIIDSTKTSSITPSFDMKISSIGTGQVITGTTSLQSSLPDNLKSTASEIRYMLIDPDTAKGFVIAKGTDLKSNYQWKPAIEDNGQKIIAAVIYDSNGKMLMGDCVLVQVGVVPQVDLKGITENQVVNASTLLSADINFNASYVKYEMINVGTGAVYISPEWDPEGTFTMVPVMEDNEGLAIRVIAYDKNDKAYSSSKVTIGVNVTPQYALKGVTSGQTVNKQVTLYASTNFNVSGIDYILRDTTTKVEKVLKSVSYGSYKWFPSTEDAGNKELYMRVKNAAGQVYTSAPIYVSIPSTPVVLLQGVGPDAVVTSDMKLSVLSNISLSKVKFILTDRKTNKEYVIAEGSDALAEYSYKLTQYDGGAWYAKAVGTYGSQTITSESVPITIYLSKIYGAKPVVEKSKFLSLASDISVKEYKKTGMSAALQTAQAILETGWGQSVPVDKYTGQFSYNLFGVKGTGSAGSVTSNTWEEYNGVAYRIDAEFRAYNNVQESWEDHNKLLLTASRYGIYRDVMYNSTQGAWALRRAGYATDSKYPMKLMEIIDLYKLNELDKVGI